MDGSRKQTIMIVCGSWEGTYAYSYTMHIYHTLTHIAHAHLNGFYPIGSQAKFKENVSTEFKMLDCCELNLVQPANVNITLRTDGLYPSKKKTTLI